MENLSFIGLGNFCFENSSQNDNVSWKEGFLVILDFTENLVSFEMIPYNQCLNNTKVVLKSSKDLDSFQKSVAKLNLVITDDIALNKEYETFLHNNNLRHVFEPYRNKYLITLYKRHLLPSFLSKKDLIRLRAHLQNESYIAKVINSLMF